MSFLHLGLDIESMVVRTPFFWRTSSLIHSQFERVKEGIFWFNNSGKLGLFL